MNIHFNHSEPVNAPAETLFDVITDYASYPSFNAGLVKVEVVTKDAEPGGDILHFVLEGVRRHDELEAFLQFIRDRNDFVAMRHSQGAARQEIILKINDD